MYGAGGNICFCRCLACGDGVGAGVNIRHCRCLAYGDGVGASAVAQLSVVVRGCPDIERDLTSCVTWKASSLLISRLGLVVLCDPRFVCSSTPADGVEHSSAEQAYAHFVGACTFLLG